MNAPDFHMGSRALGHSDGDEAPALAGVPAGRIAARTASGAAWLVAARLGGRALDFAVLLLLARLLTPADFGIVAIAVTLVQIAETIFELPVSQVIVRSPSVEPGLLDTAFTLGLVRSLLLAGLLAACAVPFAQIYGDGRLVGLILALSLAPVMRGIVSPAMAQFARALDFRRAAALDLGAKLVGLVLAAALAASTLRSYWAIVLVTVATPAAATVLSFVLAPYRPRISLAGWRAFSGFLGWFTLSQLVSAMNWKASRLVLGAVAPRAVMGTFSMANDLASVPEQALIKPVFGPLMAGFAQVQNDRERLARAYQRSLGALAVAGLPVLVALAVLAEPAVRLALGAKWQATPPVVSGLAWAACLSVLTGAFSALCLATGRTANLFWFNLLQLAIGLPLTLGLTVVWGLEGAVAAAFASNLAYMIAISWIARGITGLDVKHQLAPLWRPVAAAAAEALVLAALRPQTAGLGGLALAAVLMSIGLAGLLTFAGALLAGWSATGRPDGIEATIWAGLRAGVGRVWRRRLPA